MTSVLKTMTQGLARALALHHAVAESGSSSLFEGYIEVVTEAGITGWAVDRRDSTHVFDVEILVDGILLAQAATSLHRGDLKSLGRSTGKGGFHLAWPKQLLDAGEHVIEVRLPDGQALARRLTVLPVQAEYPMSAGVPPIAPHEVAVVVPVYNAAEDVEVCIERLARFTPAGVDILLIDDASPDPLIARILARAVGRPGFKVLRNDVNMGFTATVNRGLDEVGRRHAILLNSDARVVPGWLPAMLRAAASRPRIATVTAMSDRAGAFSAPRIGNDNPLPAGVDEITFARAFRRRGLGRYPLVPTGNGFCMFVNRACIDEIGALDAEAFPRGYGEENDFCMRAGRAGWCNVIDDRTYVFHARSKSFGSERQELLAAGRAVVDARYPDYEKAIAVFSQSPDIVAARFRAQLALADCAAADAHLPATLYVVSTQSGGTPQTNMDLMREMADETQCWLLHCDSHVLTLSCLRDGRLSEVKAHRLAEPVSPLSHRSAEYDAVVRDWLDFVDPVIVHIRHMAWHGLSLPALARAQGSRVVFSFHDFYTLCPTVKLLDENNVYCGGTCTATPGECRVEIWDQHLLPRIKQSWVHVWRSRFAEALQSCDAYVTTSESARATILQHMPLAAERFFVIPHGRSFSRFESLRQQPRAGEPLRILVPGNIDAAKGLDVIKRLVDHDASGRLQFHILGTVSPPGAADGHPAIRQWGAYAREDFARRVAEIRPHLGAVLSVWDETFCHTLTELWSVGVPAVVLDFPTLSGRVRASGAGWVLQPGDTAALYERLLAFAAEPGEQQRVEAALRRWQQGAGQAETASLMAARYRAVYRASRGLPDARPRIAVVLASAADPAVGPASSGRLGASTANAPDRGVVYVRMTPEALLANLQETWPDGAVLQARAIAMPLVEPLADAFRSSGVRYLLDLADGSFAAPAPQLAGGSALDRLIAGAAIVIRSDRDADGAAVRGWPGPGSTLESFDSLILSEIARR